MNIELLNEVGEYILDEPLKFNMSMWVESDDDSPCGTVACIAGSTVLLTKNLPDLKTLKNQYFSICLDIENVAKEELELTANQTKRLFFLDNWPIGFRSGNYYQLSKDEQAELAFWRIQHFIATNGQD